MYYVLMELEVDLPDKIEDNQFNLNLLVFLLAKSGNPG